MRGEKGLGELLSFSFPVSFCFPSACLHATRNRNPVQYGPLAAIIVAPPRAVPPVAGVAGLCLHERMALRLYYREPAGRLFLHGLLGVDGTSPASASRPVMPAPVPGALTHTRLPRSAAFSSTPRLAFCSCTRAAGPHARRGLSPPSSWTCCPAQPTSPPSPSSPTPGCP